jgi:hypothetical protein
MLSGCGSSNLTLDTIRFCPSHPEEVSNAYPNLPNCHYTTYSMSLYINLNIQIQAHLGNLEALGRSAGSQAGWQALGVTVSIALGKWGAPKPNLNFLKFFNTYCICVEGGPDLFSKLCASLQP